MNYVLRSTIVSQKIKQNLQGYAVLSIIPFPVPTFPFVCSSYESCDAY